MTQVIKYVGRTTNLKGQTVWEIVSNLKNFGVGRVIVRNVFERYPEKSFMKILKVEASHSPPSDSVEMKRKCTVLVEKVFRGRKHENPVKLFSTTYKNDYRLLSKKEEAEYCKVTERPIQLIDPMMDLPPLLKELVTKEKGCSDIQMKVHFRHKDAPKKVSRLAKEGEKPDIQIKMGIGKPHPSGVSLYQGINL